MQAIRGRAIVGVMMSLLIITATGADANAQPQQPQQPPTDDGQRSAARALANEGVAALNAGKHREALDLFGRAEALVHAPPHFLYMARTYVALGKLVQAHEAYVKIAREDLPSNAPKAFVEAKKSAVQELNALDARIPKLTIVMKGAPAESFALITVTMDDADVPNALVGVSHPVDPGTHTLRAKGPGFKSADVSVKLVEGASETATINLFVDNSTKPAAATSSTRVTSDDDDKKKKGVGPAPWIAFGVGVVGLGVGTFFVAQNRSKRDEADAICADRPCPSARRDEIVQLDKDADAAQNIAWIGYGVAAAGVLAGVTLLIVGKSSASSSSATATTTTTTPVRVWFAGTSAGMAGAF